MKTKLAMSNINFFVWLFEVSAGIALMALVYRLMLSGLTFFYMNRAFLVAGFAFCLIVPILPVPLLMTRLLTEQNTFERFDLPVFNGNVGTYQSTPDLLSEPATDWLGLGINLLSAIYLIGFLIRFFRILRSLFSLRRVKEDSFLVRREKSHKIFLQSTLPTFSFWNSIYLNEDTENLAASEMELVLYHERVHIRQKHSIDILFYEFARTVFWFHPCLGYLVKCLKEVHEYLADRQVVIDRNAGKGYGQLLVKLASQQCTISLVHTFSDSQLYNRITMITKQNSSRAKMFRFLAVVPANVAMIFLCSCLSNDRTQVPISQEISQFNKISESGLTIEKISWTGNTKHSDAEMNRVFGIKAGDAFDSIRIEKALYGNWDGGDLSGLYMDDGYLFFRVDVKPVFHGKKVNLNLDVFEGKKARIGKITVKGNRKISTEKVLSLINIKPGSLFNRAELVRTQEVISKSGLFNPTTININPIPDMQSFEKNEIGTVDFEYKLTEL
jgi:hypothetical protein